ncbi:hypothetical protein BU17DRAFT_101789 [Hysterangium stoloniferum]|nr:hypothetical protein BU17DRAFT_101789 [Hysterangium stoloniferum]
MRMTRLLDSHIKVKCMECSQKESQRQVKWSTLAAARGSRRQRLFAIQHVVKAAEIHHLKLCKFVPHTTHVIWTNNPTLPVFDRSALKAPVFPVLTSFLDSVGIGLASATYLAFFGQVNSIDITTPYQLGGHRFLETIQLHRIRPNYLPSSLDSSMGSRMLRFGTFL